MLDLTRFGMRLFQPLNYRELHAACKGLPSLQLKAAVYG